MKTKQQTWLLKHVVSGIQVKCSTQLEYIVLHDVFMIYNQIWSDILKVVQIIYYVHSLQLFTVVLWKHFLWNSSACWFCLVLTHASLHVHVLGTTIFISYVHTSLSYLFLMMECTLLILSQNYGILYISFVGCSMNFSLRFNISL